MLNIFIVDDSEIKTNRIEKVLKDSFLPEEINVIKSNSTSGAMSILLTNVKIDLMILDLNLPIREGEKVKEKSGLRLLREISKRHNISRPNSIIGLTSFEDVKKDLDHEFNIEGWVIAKFDLKETNWEELLINKISYIMTSTKSNSIPLIVILTALKEEYIAVRNHLNNIVDEDKNDTSYESGMFIYKEKIIAKVIIRECGAKNTNASQETERVINYFNPQAIFFVGIAGSRKPKDFGIGDVIFPEKVYSYEGGKSEGGSFYVRPDNALMSYTLLEKAKKERNRDDWKILIKGNWDVEVKADLGVIASGEKVIESYYSGIGKILQDHYNDTSAVEMEGFGFGKAANRQGRETNNILIGVVRGISDILDQSIQNNDKQNDDKRPINRKEFASNTAAAFAYWLIFKTFE